MNVLELVERGAVSQIRVAFEVERIASMESDIVNQTNSGSVTKQVASNDNSHSQQSEPMLFLNKKGKAVGKLKNNGKKITLTIACTALDEEREKALHEFVNDLVRNNVTENEQN